MPGCVLFLACLASYLGGEYPLRDACDLIELNHYYDGNAALIFSQVIFYRWDVTESRYQVIAWRMYKNRSQSPIYDNRTRLWVAIWVDGRALRRVTSTAYRETWTQYDPELEERSKVPKDKRAELSTGVKLRK